MLFSVFRRLVVFLLCGWLNLSLASAQGAVPGAAPLTRAQVSFILVAGAKPSSEVFLAVARGPGTPVKIGTAKSAPVAYEGPAQLVLYAPDTKTKDGRVTLAIVTLPSKSERILVLLAPGGGPGAPLYSAVAVEDDVTAMPAGSLRFLNYSGKPAAVQVAKETITLGKGANKVFTVAAQAKEPVEVVVQVASQEQEGYDRAFSSRLRIRSDERQTFILLPPAKPGARGITVTPSRDLIVPISPKDKSLK